MALSPGTAVTGFPPGQVIGATHIDTTGPAAACMYDLSAAITDANGRSANLLMNGEIGSMTLAPGVYKSNGGFIITGTLTLDGGNDPNAAWIFIMATTLVVNTGAKVILANYDDSQGVHVWWSCGERADIFTTAVLKGTVMAYTSIAAQDSATTGPLMANTGQVALLNNQVKSFNAAMYPRPTSQPSSSPSTSPSTLPTSIPTSQPSLFPSAQPSGKPTSQPSEAPERILGYVLQRARGGNACGGPG